jgi:bifunctional enzyme CysN/CysC
MSVTVLLADQLDAGRGNMICTPGDEPVVARRLSAHVAWMTEEPLKPGGRYLLRHTTRTVRATVEALDCRVDVANLGEEPRPDQLELNDIGRVRLRLSAPVLADPYDRNRPTGAFILIDEVTRNTVGAGMIRTADEDEFQPDRSPNVTWHEPDLRRDERWSKLGVQGATIWLTGLPASGKSTIAGDLEERLVRSGRSAYRLDGDNLRHGLNADLGFEIADRQESVRRAANAARLLADAGTIAVVSLVSPYEDDRQRARELHEEAGLDFIEVFVDTPLEVCEQRDPKGLYAKARRGEITRFTGIDDPYEAPVNADIVVTPGDEENPVDRLLAALAQRGVLTSDQ